MTSADDPTTTVFTCPVCGGPLAAKEESCTSCAATAAAEPPARQAAFTGPKRIAGYRILREIGSGGMGTVFEAYEERMHRNVALKVLSRHHAPSEKAGRRFEHEAWIGGKLDHPNLVKVYEHGKWEELSFYSMELVGGGSLHDVISNMRRWGRDDRIGLEFGSADYIRWAISQIVAAASGLDYAHRKGVVHRDIKPMNLLLSRELETVKIADFGLAIDTAASRLTTAGKVLGTLAYMAPEQILGESRKVDARTDVYSLGVTLFELLTRELPYKGETQQLYMNAVLTSEARRAGKLNERVGRDLEIVIRKALEKDPKDRYRSAAAFAEDLENVLHFRPIRAVPSNAVQRIRKWVRRKPMHAALVAVLAVGLPTLVFLAERAVERRRLVREQRIEELWNEIRPLLQQDRDRQLLEPASELLRLDPDNVRMLQLRSVSYMHLARQASNPERAAEYERKSLGDIDAVVRLRPDSHSSYRLKEFVSRELGRESEAREAAALAERHRSAEPSYAELYLDGLLALETGEYERAAELFGKIVVDMPGSTDPLLFRARAYEEIGRTEAAILDYRLATALNPNDLTIHHNLGVLLTRTGAFDEGAAYLRKAMRLGPGTAHVHEALSDNHIRKGEEAAAAGDTDAALAEFREAEQEARQSLEFDPELPWSHLNLGASLLWQQRLTGERDTARIEEVAEHYTRALSIWKDSGATEDAEGYSTALLNYCDALLQMRELARAADVCSEVARIRPDDPVAFYNLAGAYAMANRGDEALRALERDFDLGDRDWRYLSGDAWFEPLRTDPRFLRLVERMKSGAEDR